jgi:peptide deformylase
MTLSIRTYPDEVLRNQSKAVKDINGELIKLAEQMVETMYLSRGIGLAAPQVGEPCCLIVVDIGEGLIELFNPKIIAAEGVEEPYTEGCLSLPEITLEIKRPNIVVVNGIDRNGKEITIEARDLMARVLQHEIDHLQGTLIIDRISKIHRQLIRGKLKKLRQENT